MKKQILLLTAALLCAVAITTAYAGYGRSVTILNKTDYKIQLFREDKIIANLKTGEKQQIYQKWMDNSAITLVGIVRGSDEKILGVFVKTYPGEERSVDTPSTEISIEIMEKNLIK